MPLSLFLYHLRHLALYPPGWRALEKKMLANHPWCSYCGAKKPLAVHHIQPIHLHPELALNPDNLIVLCPWDHLREGHVSDFQKGFDPDIKTRAFENITKIRIIQTNEGVKP